MRYDAFTILGTLDCCLSFHFSVPAEIVQPLVPEPLQLVTYRGCAFWNVTAARVRHLRPRPLPRWLGATCLHVDYRLLVRMDLPGLEPVQGLYTVRSDVAGRIALTLARLLGHARAYAARVSMESLGGEVRLRVDRTPKGQADADVRVDVSAGTGELPAGSRFPNFETASRILDCAPTNLSYDPIRREIAVVPTRAEEAPWKPQPVRVLESRWNYLIDARHGGEAIRPEPAFWIGPLHYRMQRQELIRLELAPAVPQPLSALPLLAKPAPARTRARSRSRPRAWVDYAGCLS